MKKLQVFSDGWTGRRAYLYQSKYMHCLQSDLLLLAEMATCYYYGKVSSFIPKTSIPVTFFFRAQTPSPSPAAATADAISDYQTLITRRILLFFDIATRAKEMKQTTTLWVDNYKKQIGVEVKHGNVSDFVSSSAAVFNKKTNIRVSVATHSGWTGCVGWVCWLVTDIPIKTV